MPDKVVVFDTSCLLCSKFIRVLLKNDQGTLHYTGFESAFSMGYLPVALRTEPETVVFYEQGKFLLKSQAVFSILQYLRLPYRWLRIFRFLPKALLDKVYDWVARRRYRWFGRSTTCFLPDNKHIKQFLD